MQPEQGPSNKEEKEVIGEEVKQNDINIDIEKEVVNSIQKQAKEIEKIQSGNNESRFSFMKYLKRENKKEQESTSKPDHSEKANTDDNGLPSYSEATMDSLGPEESKMDPVTFADGATQTLEEEILNDDDTETLLEQGENTEESEKIEDEKPQRFRFFNFARK